MTYAETLAYLYAQLPMFQRIGKAAYKADLSNTHALMELTGHPEQGLRCVHVAGTNGKGSTSHMIASVLQEAGYTVGLHTSPTSEGLPRALPDQWRRWSLRQIVVRLRGAQSRGLRAHRGLVLRVGCRLRALVVPGGSGWISP